MIPDLPLDPDLPPALRRREFLRLLGAAGVATLGLGAPKLLARVVAREVDDAVLNFAIIEHHHHEYAIFRECDELDLGDRGDLGARHGDDACQSSHVREQLRCVRDQGLRIAREVRSKLLPQLIDRNTLEGTRAQQGIDEETIAAIGRDATRRGVRRDDEAQFLEIGHDITNGRRGKTQARFARQRSRADGLSIPNVALDEHPQQLLGAIVQRVVIVSHG